MDLEQLAREVIEVLASRFRRAGESAGEGRSHEEQGEPSTVRHEDALHEILREALAGSTFAKPWRRFQTDPSDEEATTVLQSAVLVLLTDDPSFATAVRAELAPGSGSDELRDAATPGPEGSEATATGSATGNQVVVGTMRGKSQFALGSIVNSRNTKISLGIGVPLVIALLFVIWLMRQSGDGRDGVGLLQEDAWRSTPDTHDSEDAGASTTATSEQPRRSPTGPEAVVRSYYEGMDNRDCDTAIEAISDQTYASAIRYRTREQHMADCNEYIQSDDFDPLASATVTSTLVCEEGGYAIVRVTVDGEGGDDIVFAVQESRGWGMLDWFGEGDHPTLDCATVPTWFENATQ